MAKFLCVCGHPLSTSGTIPNPDEWRCLSDADFEALYGPGQRGGPLTTIHDHVPLPDERSLVDLLAENRQASRTVRPYGPA